MGRGCKAMLVSTEKQPNVTQKEQSWQRFLLFRQSVFSYKYAPGNESRWTIRMASAAEH